MKLWYWHSSTDIKPRGPFNLNELKELVRIGELKHFDKVWREEFENWVPASQIEFLFPQPAKGIFERSKDILKKSIKKLTSNYLPKRDENRIHSENQYHR